MRLKQPENLTLADAQNRVGQDRAAAQYRESIRRALKGDHWQDGEGWAGPRPPAGSPHAPEFMAEVQKQYTPKNAVREVARRHLGAVLGRWPSVKVALRDATAEATPEQARLIEEGEALITFWADRNRVLLKLRKFGRELLLGQGLLRSYVPSGELQEGRIPPADLTTSMGRIRLMVPLPESCEVVDDEATGRRYSVYRAQGADGSEIAELCYLDAQGRTVIRRLEQGETVEGVLDAAGAPARRETEQTSAPLNLHGLLTVTVAEREQFLTSEMLLNNRMLNFAKTAILRNAELAALLERYGIGVLPPGKYVNDPTEPGGVRFEADPDWRPGGSNATFFTPATFTDEEGRAQVIDKAHYGRFEPVSPEALIATKSDAYHDILDEAGQSHMRMTGDGNASGEARIQAMNDFRVSLYDTASPIDVALAEHLEMVLAWAAALSGQPGLFKDFRVVVQCRVLHTQPTVDERRQVMAERDGGLRSTENAMSEIGIEDTDQMIEAVRLEQSERTQRGQAEAERLARLLDPPQRPREPSPAAEGSDA